MSPGPRRGNEAPEEAKEKATKTYTRLSAGSPKEGTIAPWDVLDSTGRQGKVDRFDSALTLNKMDG